MINGWFQGMGFPPCARAFTHWVPPRELATKMSIWNASTNIGAGAVVVMCGYLLSYYGNWRLCFFVPAAIAFLCAVFLWFALPDTPPSVGLPEVEGTQSQTAADRLRRLESRRRQARLQQSLYLAARGGELLRLYDSLCHARLGPHSPHSSQAPPTHPRRLDGRRLRDFRHDRRAHRRLAHRPALRRARLPLLRVLHGPGRRLDPAVLESGGRIGLAQHPSPLPLGLLHLRSPMPHQHCRRQPRHQTRRRHRRRPRPASSVTPAPPFPAGAWASWSKPAAGMPCSSAC